MTTKGFIDFRDVEDMLRKVESRSKRTKLHRVETWLWYKPWFACTVLCEWEKIKKRMINDN